MNKIIIIFIMLVCSPLVRAEDMMDVSRIQKGEVKWASLTDGQIAELTRIHDELKEVEPSPLEPWIDDFRRDQNPDREIAVWRHMADVYAHAVEGKNATLDYKKEAFKLVLACSMMPRKNVLERVAPVIVSSKTADAIMAEFYDTH